MRKLKNIVWFMVLLLLQYGTANAQKTYKLSATEAVNIAFSNVTELKNLKIDSMLQAEKNREITGMALPQISGSVSAQHFLNIPVTVLPDFLSPAVYGVLAKEGVKDRNGNPIPMPTAFGSFPASFGVPWQASAGATLQQLLFQPDVFIGLKARKASLDYAGNNMAIMKDSIKSNVYRSYYAVLIAEKRLGFLNESLKRLQKLYADQEAMYKQGFIEKLDIDKTQVTLNNLTTTQVQVMNGIQMGYAALKFALGIKQADELQLTDALDANTIKADILENAENVVYENRPEIKMLNTVKTLQQLDLQRNKLQYVPTVAAFWNYSKNAQRQKFDFFNKGDWFTTSVIGVNMSVPIWNGGQRESKVRQTVLNVEKTNNVLNQVKQVVDIQHKIAKLQITNALSNLDVQQRNIALAEKVFNTTKIKYQQGLGSSFELLQSEQSLQDAQTNYYISLYDAIISKVALLKAVGKL